MTARKREEKRLIPFSVDGHILQELGERLVARPSIALAELVKNAYDADATKVTLKFRNVAKIGGSIEVEDDGHGMLIRDIEKTWMKIATSDKRLNPISPKYHRTRAGEKGVGRFACQVLADELVLESVALTHQGKEKLTARFTWSSYWTRSDIGNAKVAFDVKKVGDDCSTGTKLVLEGTRQVWSKESIAEMRRDILSLISPFSWESQMKSDATDQGLDPGFTVLFDIPEMEEFEGTLASYYLDAAWGKLDGRLEKDGSTVFRIESWRGTKDSYSPEKAYTHAGPFSFRIYWYRRAPEDYGKLGFRIRDIQKALTQHAGVRVYLGGFRVFPFGEPGDDWLEIDKERAARTESMPELLAGLGKSLHRPLLLLPANNQLVGAVFLSRKENPGIVASVTRDRIVKNKAFEEVTEIVKLAVHWMTIVYARETEEERRVVRKAKQKKSRASLDTIRETAKEALETSDSEKRAEALSSIQDLATNLEEILIQEEEDLMAVIDLYQVLASTGTMVGILGHELTALVEALDQIGGDIEETSKSVPLVSRNRLGGIKKDLDSWTSFIKRLAHTVGVILSQDSRDQRVRQVIHEAVDIVAAAFLSYCTEHKILVTNTVPETLTTSPMFLAQLYSIIANLLTNAVKWVMFGDDRRIKFGGRRTSEGIEFWALDSGPGVPPDIREEVFKPFVSYSTPNLDKGTGTGLGLTIVRNFVTEANGEVAFIDPPEGWNTCCRILFRG